MATVRPNAIAPLNFEYGKRGPIHIGCMAARCYDCRTARLLVAGELQLNPGRNLQIAGGCPMGTRDASKRPLARR